jgi:lysophospholipase L1-like esterase
MVDQAYSNLVKGSFLGIAALGFGFLLGVGVIFWSETLQNSIRWRSEHFFNRTPKAQLDIERETIGTQRRGLGLVSPNSIVLLGDSHLSALPSSSIGSNVINLAVGGLTSQRLLNYLLNQELQLPNNPAQIILLIGANDVFFGSQEVAIQRYLKELQELLSTKAKVTFIEIPSLRAAESILQQQITINRINAFLKELCNRADNCKLIELGALKTDDGFLRAEYAAPDGLHLSALGYQKFLALIREKI